MAYLEDLENRLIQVDNYYRETITYYVDGFETCLRRNWNNRGYCSYKAGYKTSKVGFGACFLHKLYGDGLMALKQGRFSKVLTNDLREHYEELMSDPEYLDLSNELALAKTVLYEALRRYKEDQDEDSLKTIQKSIELVVGSVDKVVKIQSNQVLTIAQGRLLMLKGLEAITSLVEKWFPEGDRDEKKEEALRVWRGEVDPLFTSGKLVEGGK